MGTKLKVYKTVDGEPQVRCPRCDERIHPVATLFDGYECPECGQVIEISELKLYFKALEDYEDGL